MYNHRVRHGLKTMRGLIIGRYQPFHNGHLEVMHEIASDSDCDELIIAIGSAQESHTRTNPFTAGERLLMINVALAQAGIANFIIIPIIDINRYAVWVAHVESLVPPIDIVYTNNQLTKQLFSERGYKIKLPKLYDREKYSGTKIREMMLNDEGWQELVPESVAKVIEDIGGVSRLKELE